MKGAVEKAEEILSETPNSFMPQQFKNPSNPEIHRKTTAEEIWRDTDEKVDVIVAGIGTGGTITGIGQVLKKRKPDIKVIGLEPESSPILTGGSPGPHRIQGIGAGFVPDILDTKIYDEIIRVKDNDAAKMVSRLLKEEGIFAGISSGAAAFGAIHIAKRKEYHNKMIVAIFPDTGERYLSLADWLFH